MNASPSDLIDRTHDLLTLVQSYGVALRRAGVNEFAGPCPACGGKDRFSVNIKKRIWNCRQCGLGGDAIALVRHVENVSFSEAIARLTGASWRLSEHGRHVPTAKSVEAVDDHSDDIAKALQRWREATDPRRTIVETYLVGRGLALDDDIAGEVIRFHPACPWLSDDEKTVIRVPAMLAAMREIRTDALVAVSCRRLTPEGAKVGKPRFRGAALGAAIKLDADENVTNGLHICEGVETGIAGRMLGLKPMWCLGSKGAIAAFPVLGGVGCLTILAEPDASDAVEKCARRAWEAGREVIINRSKIGKDLADALAERRRA